MTSIVGQKIVVSTDPEVNNYIFQQEDKIFECFYTDGFVKLLGTESILAYHGNLHKYIKNLILRLVSPENLKENLLHGMDLNTRNAFRSWSSHGSVEVKEESADVCISLSLASLQFLCLVSFSSRLLVPIPWQFIWQKLFIFLTKKLTNYYNCSGTQGND